MEKRLTTRIDKELHKRLKMKAIKDERDMNEVVSLLIQGYVDGKITLTPAAGTSEAGKECDA